MLTVKRLDKYGNSQDAGIGGDFSRWLTDSGQHGMDGHQVGLAGRASVDTSTIEIIAEGHAHGRR